MTKLVGFVSNFAQYVEHSGDIAEDIPGDGPDVSLPIEWSGGGDDGSNGPAVTDPLMLYVAVPAMGDPEDPNSPIWKIPLAQVVYSVVGDFESPTDGTILPEDMQTVIAIRDALQALTDKLSATIIEKTSPDSDGLSTHAVLSSMAKQQ